MVRLVYTTVKGNKVRTYAEAIAEGGIKARHYEPIEEPVHVSPKQLDFWRAKLGIAKN